MSDPALFAEAVPYLHALFSRMPPVSAMQVRVRDVDAGMLCLHAPLQANSNDKQNAFGGSVTGLMTLASWSWLMLRLHEAGDAADVYVADSQVHYLIPVYEDLAAVAAPAPTASWDNFLNAFRKRDKARIDMAAQMVLRSGKVAATLKGRFVAFAKR